MGAFDADSATGIFSGFAASKGGFAAPESGNSRPSAGNFYLLSVYSLYLKDERLSSLVN
jgi:hypothetical protein